MRCINFLFCVKLVFAGVACVIPRLMVVSNALAVTITGNLALREDALPLQPILIEHVASTHGVDHVSVVHKPTKTITVHRIER